MSKPDFNVLIAVSTPRAKINKEFLQQKNYDAVIFPATRVKMYVDMVVVNKKIKSCHDWTAMLGVRCNNEDSDSSYRFDLTNLTQEELIETLNQQFNVIENHQ